MISASDLKSKKRSRTRCFIFSIKFETTKTRQSFPVFYGQKRAIRGPSFNSILTSVKETLGNLFMFYESEKGLKDDSDVLVCEK